MRKTVDFATERDLFVLAHCDERALAIMLANNPKAKMIWAHTGFSTAVEQVRDFLDKHPALMIANDRLHATNSALLLVHREGK